MTLSEIEKTVLIALADACDYSLSAHVPIQYIRNKIPPNPWRDAKKALNKLRRKGYCSVQPTGRNRTWRLSRLGLHEARQLLI
jgi:hypothetical protein